MVSVKRTGAFAIAVFVLTGVCSARVKRDDLATAMPIDAGFSSAWCQERRWPCTNGLTRTPTCRSCRSRSSIKHSSIPTLNPS
jgi:hypothetical protein